MQSRSLARAKVENILWQFNLFRYYWTKNGQDFNWAGNIGRYTKYPGEGTIVLARPGTDDDGMYQCFAENKFGVAVSNVINVKRAGCFMQNFIIYF